MVFFFSSRRRHTRFKCDWSSDVCSSDLLIPLFFARGNVTFAVTAWSLSWIPTAALGLYLLARAGHLNIRLDLKVARALLRFGIVGYLSFVTNFLNFRLDTFLVNIVVNPTQVG